MKNKYPICIPGSQVDVPQMTDKEIREGLEAAGAVVMKGCECGGRFERVDNIVVDTVADGERIVVRHLHGIRCDACGMEALSPESMRTVERKIRERQSRSRYTRLVHATHEPRRGIPI